MNESVSSKPPLMDLHLHLSGAVSQATMWEQIKRSGFKTGIPNFREYAKFTSLIDRGSLDNYLDVLHFVDKAQSSPEAIRACVYNAFASSYLSGADYVELRFNPVKRSQEGSIDLDAIIVAARAGMEEAKIIYGIEGGLILCLGRDLSVEANAAIFKKALQYQHKGIRGIDIAGPYIEKDPEAFYDLHGFPLMYATAFDRGMVTTVHAAEIDHPSVVQETAYIMKKLAPQRIGHGIQVLKHPELIDLAKDLNCIFEFCPTSNLATNSIKDMDDLLDVVADLNRHKLRHVICTDATFLLNTDIKKEHDLYHAALGSLAWTEEDKQAGLGPCTLELSQ